jgi:hypothetical protein
MSKLTLRNFTAISFGAMTWWITAASAQSVEFPAGSAPVMAAPSVKQTDASGRPAMMTDASTGRQFIPTYDQSGHLTSLKSSSGRNACDIRAIIYTPDGHPENVSFGNQYQLIFRYHLDGTQEVIDSFGGSIVRSQAAPGKFTTKSVVDPSGFLAPTLERVDALLSLIGPVSVQAAGSTSIAQ